MKTGYPERILKHCLNMRDGNRKSKAQIELKIIRKPRSFLSAVFTTKRELGKIVT